MNAISICVSLLVALVALVLVNTMRKLRPEIAASGSQRMCPSCGLITSRSEACCLECGNVA